MRATSGAGENAGAGGAAEVSPRRRRAAVLRARRAPFIELLRTTPPRTVCPNFYILAHANGCSFAPNCSYCYLKSSLWHVAEPQVFVNTDRLLREVRRWIERAPLESYVLNTGNLSDSLAFEGARPLAGALVELFRAQAEARGRPHTLLLVTKGGLEECAALLATPPCRNAIVSFSVNHPEAARQYEAGAAPPAERLEAARRLKARGWRVRLRLDPLIEGYDYDALVREAAALAPERVTLGSLRAERNLYPRVGAELFAALEEPADPRDYARYPLPRRLALYRRVLERLRPIPCALCEETENVWRALGLDAESRACNCAL